MPAMAKHVRVHQNGIKMEVMARIMVHIDEVVKATKSQVEAWFEKATRLSGIAKDVSSWKNDGVH